MTVSMTVSVCRVQGEDSGTVVVYTEPRFTPSKKALRYGTPHDLSWQTHPSYGTSVRVCLRVRMSVSVSVHIQTYTNSVCAVQ